MYNNIDELVSHKTNKPIMKLEKIRKGVLKVDFDTRLETTFITIAFVFLLLSIISFLILLFDGYEPGEKLEYQYFVGISSFICIVAFFLRSKTDDYYKFDLNKKTIVFVRNFFTYNSEEVLVTFKEIYALSLKAKLIRTKYSSYWQYQGAIISKNGKIIEFTDSFLDNEHESNSQLIESIANIMQVRFINNYQRKMSIEVDKVFKDSQIKYLTAKDIKRKRIMLVVIIAVVFFVLAIVISILIAGFSG